jgi:GAF domain-containing protein
MQSRHPNPEDNSVLLSQSLRKLAEDVAERVRAARERAAREEAAREEAAREEAARK